MRNFVQPGDKITIVAPNSVESGGGVQFHDTFGVATTDAASGEKVVIATAGVYTLPKVSTDEIFLGERVYWDSGPSLVTNVDAANTLIGVAVSDATNPSGTVNVRLNGAF